MSRHQSQDEVVESPSAALELPYLENATCTEAALDLTLHAHNYLNEALRFGDAKAGVVLGISGALLSRAVLSALEAVKGPESGWVLLAITYGLAMLALGYASWLAVSVVAPRHRPSKRAGFIFWEDIRFFEDREGYLRSTSLIDMREAVRDVAQHNWSLTSILHDKYGRLRRAIAVLEAGAGILLLALLLQIGLAIRGR
jgi:hypothetical protein